jgi:hypothetical protein
VRSSLWFIVLWPGVCIASCSLTQSLDDLKGGTPPDAGGAAGGTAGSGGMSATGGTGGTSTGGGSGGASDAGDGSAGDADGDAPADPCVNAGADAGGCANCCVQSHAQGSSDFLNAIQTCVCQTGTSCASTCSTYCGGGTLDTACSQCVSQSTVQACIGSNCASAECQTYLACIGACK